MLAVLIQSLWKHKRCADCLTKGSIHYFIHSHSPGIPQTPPRPFPEGGLLRLLISVGEFLHYLALSQQAQKHNAQHMRHGPHQGTKPVHIKITDFHLSQKVVLHDSGIPRICVLLLRGCFFIDFILGNNAP